MVRTGSVWRLCALLALGTACQSKFQKTLLVPPELKISAVFVYPFTFRWEEPAYRSFELSQRLVAVAIRRKGDAAMLFGPSEFKVYRLDDANPWAASNAISLLPPVSIRPERAIVLRASAERRVLASEKELLNPAGNAAGATRSREVTYLGRVELLHPSSRQVIAELSGQVVADPFAPVADEADPMAELTQLMERLTAEALDLIENHFSPPAPSRRWPWVLAFNPPQALSPAEEGSSSLQVELAKLDPLEADALRLSRIRFANPGIPDSQAAQLIRFPRGLWVTSAPPGDALQPGDLIASIDGAPALPQVLQRAQFRESPVQARVRKASGDFVELMLR
jgi:hypothetical protein